MIASETLASQGVILASVMVFGLAAWLYFERHRDNLNLTLGALLTAGALWSFSLILWRQSPTAWQAAFWIKTSYSLASILPGIFVMHAYSVWRGKVMPAWMQGVFLLPGIILSSAIYFGQTLSCGLDREVVCWGPFHLFLMVHFALLSLMSLAVMTMVLARRFGREVSVRGLNLAISGGIIVMGVVFVIMYLTALTVRSEVVWFGNILALIGMFLLAASSPQKKQVKANIKLVGIEIFALALLTVVISDLVTSQTLMDFSLRLAILVVLIVYGTVTVRNTVNEIRQVETIASMTGQLTEMNGRLLDADKLKTQFVSFASHQLRAPISGVRSYLDMLLDGDFGKLNDRQRQALTSSHEALSRMGNTVETFLGIAKSELGEMTIYRSETNLVKLIDEVIKTFRPMAAKKGLTLEMEAPGGPLTVQCDSGKIYHVLTNLIDNAIKYTDSGSVRVGIWRMGKFVQVKVSDTGVGLSDEEQSGLFWIFKRGLAGVRLNGGGSGLGLHIVKKIVTAHGGEVSVESSGYGHGSTFGFTIPIQ